MTYITNNITISFFGHSNIFNISGVRKRLLVCVEEKIRQGANRFLVGVHGHFDQLALSVCEELKQKYDIEICLVFTTLTILKEKQDVARDLFGDNIKPTTYDIENTHFKNTITYTNHKMIDDSDFVICYVDEKISRSGAKNAMKYAKRNKKRYINLYEETDEPFYRMTNEEKEKAFKKFLKKDS